MKLRLLIIAGILALGVLLILIQIAKTPETKATQTHQNSSPFQTKEKAITESETSTINITTPVTTDSGSSF